MKEMFILGLKLMLFAIVAGLLISVCYVMTEEPIAAQKEATANAARQAVMPDGGGFERVDVDYSGVDSVFANSMGYVFEITGRGYGSGGIAVTVGVFNDGSISGVRLNVSNETPGLGAKAGNESYYGQYAGKNAATVDDVSAITGATITCSAVKQSIKLALEAFETLALEGGAAN